MKIIIAAAVIITGALNAMSIEEAEYDVKKKTLEINNDRYKNRPGDRGK